jgi:hypothetical protein
VDAAIEETFAKLKLLNVFNFYKTPVLTQEQKGWLQFICDRYLTASPDERARIHSIVTPETSFLFFMYAKAMAVEAVHERQEGKIFEGLIALAGENQIFDWRDSMMVLVLLHHSAAKIGADASQLFQRAAAIATPQTSEGLLQFWARAPENLDLAKFGYQEGIDSEGDFTYVLK